MERHQLAFRLQCITIATFASYYYYYSPILNGLLWYREHMIHGRFPRFTRTQCIGSKNIVTSSTSIFDPLTLNG